MSNKAKLSPIQGQRLQPDTEIWLEVEKEFVKNSLKVTQKFCRDMISISLSALPVYLGLLKLFQEKIFSSNTDQSIFFWVFLPSVLFFSSSIAFFIGALIREGTISTNCVNEIKENYNRILRKRYWWLRSGTILFLGGNIISLFCLLFMFLKNK